MKVLTEATGKGAVKWIRLRFYYKGKRLSISTGLSWNDANLALANQTATQIVSDIYQNIFDESLLKYRPLHVGRNPTAIAVTDLFERFTKYKSGKISPNSLVRYQAVTYWLKELLSSKTCDRLTKKDAQAFINELYSHVKTSTLTVYLSLLKGCWKWSEGQFTANADAWQNLDLPKNSRTKKTQPLSLNEIKDILKIFYDKYPEYFDFACWQLSIGTRPSEAAGLTWDKVFRGFTEVEISASYSRGQSRDSTKTGVDRTITLPIGVSQLLRQKFEKLNPDREDYVFLVDGKPVDDRAFRRLWIAVLKLANIPYRKPYGTRHSVISLALSAGANPLAIAADFGHSPEMMLKAYATNMSKESSFVALPFGL